jgi:hypothetical protein
MGASFCIFRAVSRSLSDTVSAGQMTKLSYDRPGRKGIELPGLTRHLSPRLVLHPPLPRALANAEWFPTHASSGPLTRLWAPQRQYVPYWSIGRHV